MKTAAFDYELPPDLIAQTPAPRRDESRLLVVHRSTRTIEHRRFFDLSGYINAGDLLIRNSARVLPARLHAQRPGGGAVECLLLRPAPDHRDQWWCLLRPGRKLPPGSEFSLPGEFTAQVLEKSDAAEYRVAISPARGGESVTGLAERIGAIPLPPYIRRADETTAADMALDRERYQTVFADRMRTVAVAAPTAGLHFTERLIAEIERLGATFADVYLHVGLGTFRPIETENVEDHLIHRELIEIPQGTRAALNDPRARRRVAVGTTSVRAVEHFARATGTNPMHDPSSPFIAEADLFLHPPAAFRYVDALVTNFHLPRSTLLCLVAAFLSPGATAGVDWLMEIYREAVAERYRFLSYGDAMLIL